MYIVNGNFLLSGFVFSYQSNNDTDGGELPLFFYKKSAFGAD
jgi:hypothetical protein